MASHSHMFSYADGMPTAAGTERQPQPAIQGGKYRHRLIIAGVLILLSAPSFAYLLLSASALVSKLFGGQQQLNHPPVTANKPAVVGDGLGLGVGWRQLMSAMMASQLMYVCTTVLPQVMRQPFIASQLERLARLVDRHRTLTFDEYESGGRMATRSRAYEEIKAYLSATCSGNGRHLRAETASGRDAAAVDKLVLSLVDGQKVSDQLFPGATVWWHAHADEPPSADTWHQQEKRLQLTIRYHERYHEFVKDNYLPRIRREGRELIVKGRQRKIFTNICSVYTGSTWSHALFEHSKTFATLAMDPARKKEIMDDLDKFKNGKDYYARVGKAWKRGYLLYGPPRTGKSSMIAAMANHLDYDIYDIELTSVHSNAELRKLLIETTPKSIILIEDIDCSLDLTGARKNQKPAAGNSNNGASASPEKDTGNRLTLSGLLNVIDGLWSCWGEERIFVFTTNHVKKLDPALIRPGRMDKHIEMGYCCIEGFKSLAKMYLDVDAHRLFDAVGELLREVEMTIANVAEHLTPKSSEDNPDSCLETLLNALDEAAAKKKANGGNEHDVQGDEQ